MLKRIIVGIILIGVLACILYFGGWVQCALFTFAALISVHEMGVVFKKKGYALFIAPLYVLAGLYFVAYRIFGMRAVFLLFVLTFALIVGERVFSSKRSTESTLYALAVMIYPLMLYVILMYAAEYTGYNASRIALLSTFALPLMGDTLAYFGGRFFGKRKLALNISPNKTVFGGISGIAGGVLGGYIVYLAQGWFPAGYPLWVLLALGFACGVLGQLGDLFASAIKRWADVKDYGKIFPGHGGVMDRLDSVLFCAPVVVGFLLLL